MCSTSSPHPDCPLRHNSNPLSASSSSPGTAAPFNWELLAVGVFVVFSFAALALAVYLIWVKCASPSPF